MSSVEWRSIEGFEGIYEISSDGRVRSLNYNHTGNVGELALCPTPNDYYKAILSYKGDISRPLIHRLVATAFIPNPKNLPQVNHIDENKTNNEVSNLVWCTAKDNANHGTRIERIVKARSKAVEAFDQTTGEVMYRFPSTAEAGRNGFCFSGVAKCCRGLQRSHKGLSWRYV